MIVKHHWAMVTRNFKQHFFGKASRGEWVNHDVFCIPHLMLPKLSQTE